MRWRSGSAAMLAGMLLALPAWGHRVDEYLQATLLTLRNDRVLGSMRLIPGIAVAPAVIAGIDANGDGVFSDAEEDAYAGRVLDDLTIAVDGQSVRPVLVSRSFPGPAQLRDGLGEIRIEYGVELPPGGRARTLTLVNGHLRARSVYLVNVVEPEAGGAVILAQKRDGKQTRYELDFEEAGAGPGTRWAAVAAWWNGVQLGQLFRLGMRHIAEGTDHLLFLLVLLLPAPLVAVGVRWGGVASVRGSVMRSAGIVTAFTVGHSVTLALGALGAVRVPGGPVEVLIAVSIFVSAMHALRPVVSGREAWIAGFFGLIHGLAFAATLDRLGLQRWDRVAGILAFNGGIEAMQMLVVVAVLPSLLLMSRTRAYPVLRVVGGWFALAASAGWVVERLWHVGGPVDAVMDGMARHGVAGALALLGVSLLCWLWSGGFRGTQVLREDDRGIRRC